MAVKERPLICQKVSKIYFCITFFHNYMYNLTYSDLFCDDFRALSSTLFQEQFGLQNLKMTSAMLMTQYICLYNSVFCMFYVTTSLYWNSILMKNGMWFQTFSAILHLPFVFAIVVNRFGFQSWGLKIFFYHDDSVNWEIIDTYK